VLLCLSIVCVVFSEHELSVLVRYVVVCVSVTFMRPTKAIETFRNVSMPFGTLAISDLSAKIVRRLS